MKIYSESEALEMFADNLLILNGCPELAKSDNLRFRRNSNPHKVSPKTEFRRDFQSYLSRTIHQMWN
jgi:hypothetical protein